MKNKKEGQDRQCSFVQGEAPKNALRWCGKMVLIGASYKIYALGISPAYAQSPAVDPTQQAAGLAADTGQTTMEPMDPAMGLQIAQVPDAGPGKCVGGCIGCTGNTGGGGGGGGGGGSGCGLGGAIVEAPFQLFGGFIQSIDDANRQAAEAQRQAAAAQRQAAEMQRQAELQRLKEIRDLDQKGADCYKRKDWANAIKFFQEALRRRPGDRGIQQHLQAAEAQALNEKGLEYFKNKNWGAAAKCFQLALGYDPNNTVMQKNLQEANKQSALQEQQAKAAADVLDGKGNVLGGAAPPADLDGSTNVLGPGLRDAVADRRPDGNTNILVPNASGGGSATSSTEDPKVPLEGFYWAPKQDPGARTRCGKPLRRPEDRGPPRYPRPPGQDLGSGADNREDATGPGDEVPRNAERGLAIGNQGE